MSRARPRTRKHASPAFWGIIIVAIAVTAGVRLVASDRGQILLVRAGIGRHFIAPLGTGLDVALARCFIDLGLLRGDVRAKVLEDSGRRVRQYSFDAPHHLTPTLCHEAIDRAVRRAGGRILHAEVTHQRTDELVLVLGFGARARTHRIAVRPTPPAAVAAARAGGPRIALVLDDLGHNMNATTRGFFALGIPLTVSVLPDLSKSKAAFAAAAEHEFPALLHLPMQPDGDTDAGRDPITIDMQPEAIARRVARLRKRYPQFIGVNNHMGSRATADRRTMTALLGALREHDAFFLDSQTTSRSLGPRVARELGVWCPRNDLFLDDGEKPSADVVANLEKLVALARRRGAVVGIMHPHAETLAALRIHLPRLQAEGVRFVTIDRLRPKSSAAAREVAAGG
jgi:polysaccharide deacetylase 2 family uncharacterized protein YibQ